MPTRLRRRIGAFLVWIASALLTTATVLSAATAARLSWGPISLDAFAPAIEAEANAALSEHAPGWRLSVAGAAIRFDAAGRRAGLTLRGVSLAGPGGAEAARAPDIALKIDPRSLVAGGPPSFEARISGAGAILLRTENDKFRFALNEPARLKQALAAVAERASPHAEASAPEAQADLFETAERMIAAWLDAAAEIGAQADAGAAAGGLKRLVVEDADLTYRDEKSDETWRAPAARFVFERTAGGVAAELDAAVHMPGVLKPVTVTLSGERPASGDEIVVRAAFEGAPTEAFGRQAPELDALSAVHALVSGWTEARLGLAAAPTGGVGLLAFEAELIAEEAEIRPPGGGAPVRFGPVAARIGYDPQSDAMTVERLVAAGEGVSVELSGEMRFIRDDRRRAMGARADLAILSATIADPSLFYEPLSVLGGGARLAFDSRAGAMTIEEIHAEIANGEDAPPLRFTGEAAVAFPEPGAPGGPSLALNLAFSETPATRLPALWPRFAAPGARAWIAENIFGGVIDGGTIAARLGGEGGDDVALDFAYSDLDSRYLANMTPIVGAAGRGRIAGAAFTLELDAGRVRVRGPGGRAGVVELAGSRVRMPDLDAEPTMAEIDLVTAGPTAALLALIDEQPLGFPARLGLDPWSVAGRHEAKARLALPLLKAVKLEEVEAAVASTLFDLAMPVDGLEGLVRGERLTLSADTKKLTLEGEARWAGAAFNAKWIETFAPAKGAARSVLTLNGSAPAAFLEAQGAPSELALKGAATVKARFDFLDGAPDRFDIDADLRPLGFTLDPLAWTKPEGRRGRLTAKGRVGDDIVVEAARLTSGDLSAEGSARFARAGAPDPQRIKSDRGVKSFEIASLRIGGDTDARFSAMRGPDGVLAIAGRGAALDLRPLLARKAPELREAAAEAFRGPNAAKAPAPAEPELDGPIDLDLAFETVRMSDLTAFKTVSLKARQGADGVFEGELKAHVGRAPVVGRLSRRPLRAEAAPEPSPATSDAALSAARARAVDRNLTPKERFEAARAVARAEAERNAARAPAAAPRPAPPAGSGAQHFTFKTDSAGGVLKAFGLFDDVHKGRLTLSGVMRANGVTTGALNIKGLVVEDAPLMAEILSVGTLIGILDKARSGGITFDRIEAPFRLDANTLAIGDAVARGPSIGMTLSGEIDRPTGKADLSGTVSPAFAINGLISGVPVIGDILTGGEGEGVVAFAYSIRGPIDDPKVGVNPLSVLAPGVLRRLIGG